MSRTALLLAAYQCAPEQGSASQIGWEWFAGLQQKHAVTLVTHARNRAALDAAGSRAPETEILYIDTEWFAGPLYRLAQRLFPSSEHSVFLIASLDYFLYDFLAWRTLRTRQRRGQRWDLIHRVTPVTLAAPSWLSRLGLAVVIGPVNCGLQNPTGFQTILRRDSSWLVHVRALARLLDGVIGSTRQAAHILTATRASLQAVPRRHRDRCSMMLENGVHLERYTDLDWPAHPGATQPLRMLFVGRLIPVKALEFLLEACANLIAAGQPVVLEVVGSGPMEATWRALAQTLRLDERQVIFHGALPATSVVAALARCHALCLPSVRESGGAVLLEAMAAARPVIALNYGGPAEIVDATVGARLPFESPAQVVRDLTATLHDIVQHPQAWQARAARSRQIAAERFSWRAKMNSISSLYADLLAKETQHA